MPIWCSKNPLSWSTGKVLIILINLFKLPVSDNKKYVLTMTVLDKSYYFKIFIQTSSFRHKIIILNNDISRFTYWGPRGSSSRSSRSRSPPTVPGRLIYSFYLFCYFQCKLKLFLNPAEANSKCSGSTIHLWKWNPPHRELFTVIG